MRNLLIILFILSLCSCLKEPEVFKNTKEGNFEALWSTIDTRYCYLSEKEINWDGVKKEYSQKLKDVKTKDDFFKLLSQMLALLKDGHVNLISDFNISRYDNWYTDSARNYYSNMFFSPESKFIKKKSRLAGGLRYEIIETSNIAYIYYGSFSNSFSAANLRNVFDYFKNCDGLIIDVRNNSGGSVTNSEKLASCFFDEAITTSYMCYKTGPGHKDFSKKLAIKTSPSKDSLLLWKKPVAVLTNRHTYSAANDFVCRMQYAPRAIIVGGWTGGGGGLPFSSELPCGWIIRFSASPMYDREQKTVENGIAPTHWVEIPEPSSPYLLPENDLIAEKAIEILKQ